MLGKLMGVALGNAETRRGNKVERGMMQQQYQNQRNLNQQGHELQMDMWNKTNYGAQLQHMKDAGLNPGLMYGMGGGGGTTAGSQGGGSAAKGSAQKQMGIEGLMAAAQTELINAQKKNVDADTQNKKDQNPNIGKQGENLDANTNLAKQSLDNKLEELRKQKLENDLTEDTYNSQVIKAEAEASNEWLKANLTAATTKKTEEETEAIRQKLVIAWKQLKVNKDNADTGRYNARTNQSNAKINKYKAEASVILQNAGLGIQEQKLIIDGLGKLLK